MALLDQHPDALLAQHEPEDLIKELRTAATLTPVQTKVLDAYLLHWSNLILHRAGDPEGVQELLSLCEMARDRLAQTTGDCALGHRWSAFEDLLELRRLVLQQAPGSMVKLSRQDEIVTLLGEAGSARMRQSELAKRLELSAGRVSQILGVLEERGVVARQRQGRDCWVSLPGPVAVRQAPAPAQSIGTSVFAPRLAA